MRWVLIGLVRGYQLVISPFLGPTCRYYPSCSAYAVEALQVHGAFRGTWLAVRRLLRCHPWAPGGVDHVPARHAAARDAASDPSPEPPAPTAERSPVHLPASAGGLPPLQGA